MYHLACSWFRIETKLLTNERKKHNVISWRVTWYCQTYWTAYRKKPNKVTVYSLTLNPSYNRSIIPSEASYPRSAIECFSFQYQYFLLSLRSISTCLHILYIRSSIQFLHNTKYVRVRKVLIYFRAQNSLCIEWSKYLRNEHNCMGQCFLFPGPKG